MKAASCDTPQHALSHSRAVHCSHLAIYLMVCMGLDRFWPQGAGGGGGGAGASADGMYAGGSSASSADKAVADMLRQIDAGDAGAKASTGAGSGSGGEGRFRAPRRGGVMADALSRLFASAPKQQRGTGTAPGGSAIADFLVDRWRSAPSPAAPSSSQYSLLSSLNGGFHFPFGRPRPALARALFVYLPAMCLFHYASTSLMSMTIDDDDGEDGAGQWDILAATDIHRSSGHFAKHHNHVISNSETRSSDFGKGGQLEGPDPAPANRPRGGLLGALEASVRDFVSDVDDDEALGARAHAPAVWLGATQSDPFTVQRVLMMAVEKPWMDGVLFQGILFLRLLTLGGLPAAMLLTPAAYARTTTNTAFDLRAMLVELRSTDAFLLNFVSGLNFCATFALTQRLWCAVMLDALVTSSYLSAEYRAREDILHSETLSLWAPAVRLLSLVERYEHLSFLVENWLLPVPRLMSKSSSGEGGSQSSSVFSFLGKPKPTAELRRLSAAAVKGFATDATATDGGSAGRVAGGSGGGAGGVVLSAQDMEDLSEGLKQAMVAVDKRPQSELSVFERARRMEYQQYLAAVKTKHKLPDIVKVMTKTVPTTASSSSSNAGSAHVKLAQQPLLHQPFPIAIHEGSLPPSPVPPRTDTDRHARLRLLALRELDRLEASLATAGGGPHLPCLRLLFDDARRASLQAVYPRGATRDQLEVYLAQQMADLASRQYIANHFDLEVCPRVVWLLADDDSSIYSIFDRTIFILLYFTSTKLFFIHIDLLFFYLFFYIFVFIYFIFIILFYLLSAGTPEATAEVGDQAGRSRRQPGPRGVLRERVPGLPAALLLVAAVRAGVGGHALRTGAGQSAASDCHINHTCDHAIVSATSTIHHNYPNLVTFQLMSPSLVPFSPSYPLYRHLAHHRAPTDTPVPRQPGRARRHPRGRPGLRGPAGRALRGGRTPRVAHGTRPARPDGAPPGPPGGRVRATLPRGARPASPVGGLLPRGQVPENHQVGGGGGEGGREGWGGYGEMVRVVVVCRRHWMFVSHRAFYC